MGRVARSTNMPRVRFLAGAAGLAAGAVALLASSAGAAVSPTLTVNPATGLAKNATVNVTGKHYAPSSSVYILECVNTATTESGCDVAGVASATTTAAGAVPKTALKVHESFTDFGGAKVKCKPAGTSTGGCVVVSAGGSPPARQATTPISFAG